MAVRETTRSTSSWAGNAVAGSPSSGSWAASSAIVPPGRRRRSDTATAQRSRSAWAWPSEATGALRHHERVTYLIAASTTPFALRAPRRADPHLDAVVLGDLRELGGEAIRAGDHDRGHAIGPPRAAGAAQPAQHPGDGVDEVGERHPLADPRPHAPREAQRADEHVGAFPPRRLGQLQPVPLD